MAETFKDQVERALEGVTEATPYALELAKTFELYQLSSFSPYFIPLATAVRDFERRLSALEGYVDQINARLSDVESEIDERSH